MLKKTYARLICLLFVVFTLGCSGSNQGIRTGVDVASFVTVSFQEPISTAGLNIVKTAYYSETTQDFVIDSTFQGGGLALLASGSGILGSSVLLAHDIYKKDSIWDINKPMLIQTIGLATGQIYVGLCISLAVQVYESYNTEENKPLHNRFKYYDPADIDSDYQYVKNFNNRANIYDLVTIVDFNNMENISNNIYVIDFVH